MNSHSHVILELPAPKEISILWGRNLSAPSSSQECSGLTRSRDRQSSTNTPSYRCCSGSLLTSSASCTTLPVHHSSPAINSVGLKVPIPTLQTTVRYLMTPLAPHRGSLIATMPRTAQNCPCSSLLLLNAISSLCTRRQVLR